MSITLDQTDYVSEGAFIEAVSKAFLASNDTEIINFATESVRAKTVGALSTAVYALIWTVQDKKQAGWKELRDLAWSFATQQFSLAKCNIIFKGL